MKKVFQPFWSYDIEKTEKWLSSMTMKGYHLVNINTRTRYFYFKEVLPQEVTYNIGFDKTYHTLPLALVNDGWKEIFKRRQWYVIANEKSLEEIKSAPLREGIVNRNRRIMYLFGGILAYMIFSSLLPIFLMFISLINNATVTVEGSPMWIVTITLGIVMWMLPIYSTIKLYKTNQRLEANGLKQSHKNSLSYDKEKSLKKTGEVIKKRKIGWIYSPDKLENWLESMEAKGYNLYRINKIGTFFFQKGNPRKVSYFADYQNTTSQSYFDMHQEAGWKLMYTSNALLSKWSIWSQAYQEGERRPLLYSDRTHLLKHARRVMITHLLLFVPLTVMYILLLAQKIDIALTYGNDRIVNWTFILFGIVIIEFSTFAVKSMLYYKRVKKNLAYSLDR